MSSSGGPRHRDNCPLDCKVYVGELGNNGTRHELEEAFGYYGPLKNVWVARNPPGFAFVMFEDPRDARDACRALNGKMICGRRVRVELSSGKTRREMGGSSNGDGPYGGPPPGRYGSPPPMRRSPPPRGRSPPPRGGRGAGGYDRYPPPPDRYRENGRPRRPMRSRSRSRSLSPIPRAVHERQRSPISRSRSRSPLSKSPDPRFR